MIKFKFNGIDDKTFYGEGCFTVGKVYTTESVHSYNNAGKAYPADAYFIDDNGEHIYEEVRHFTEVIDEV